MHDVRVMSVIISIGFFVSLSLAEYDFFTFLGSVSYTYVSSVNIGRMNESSSLIVLPLNTDVLE